MLAVKTFTFSPIQENTYILYNENRECCIIDPGCYFPEEREKLRSSIEKLDLRPISLLNTHCHLDHVFGNKFVAETWGLEPCFHVKEKPVFDFAPTSGDMWQMPFENYSGPLHYVKEGEQVFIGQDALNILFTPGHSPGSISFYNEEGKFVISGDVLFDGSVGRTDLPGGDFDTLVQSIQTQLFTLPDETRVYSGHGKMTTVGFEKMNNPYVKLY